MNGTIVRLVRDRRFGFIRSESPPQEVFFHLDHVVGGFATWANMTEGDNVSFDVVPSDKGPVARLVEWRPQEGGSIPEQLRRAALDIERALSALNTTAVRDDKGRRIWENFQHAKTYGRLKLTPLRLRQEAEALAHKNAFTSADAPHSDDDETQAQ